MKREFYGIIEGDLKMKTERICAHWIEYCFNEDEERELDDSDIEHIRECLIENYTQGELCQQDNETEETYYGWWNIET